MGKFSKWFRGAKDSDPATEQTEVDLAQAIIDLHRVDPNTGEVMDVDGDVEKVAELKVVIEGIKDKLSPDELQKLTDAVNNMVVKPEAVDNAEVEEETMKMDEDLKKAMDSCGLDAENEEEAKAFAEGVKYGEKLEANPAEREKLDSEHESEGMKKAMYACGLDSDNPEEAKAFAEGVKYGEEKAEAKAEDEDVEVKEEAKAEDADEDAPVVDKDPMEIITAILPDLTDEQKEKLQAAFATIAGEDEEPVEAADEDPEAKDEDAPKAAQDKALKRKAKKSFGAMDAALIKARATSDAMTLMRDLHTATRTVRPLVGELDPLAFDSAAKVYGYTLEQLGYNPAKYERKSWRGMVDAIIAERNRADIVLKAPFAKDSKSIPSTGHFAGLSNISLGE